MPYKSLPLTEVNLRLALPGSAPTESLVYLMDLQAGVGEDFQVLDVVRPETVPGFSEFEPARLFLSKSSREVIISCSPRLIKASWIASGTPTSATYPGFEILFSAVMKFLRARQELVVTEAHHACNIEYINQFDLRTLSVPLHELLKIPNIEGVSWEEVQEYNVAWRKDGIDLRKVLARIGDPGLVFLSNVVGRLNSDGLPLEESLHLIHKTAIDHFEASITAKGGKIFERHVDNA